MSLAILFHFLNTQHVSDINTSIIRSLRLCCLITTSVVLFSVSCVLEIWCGWVWVVSVLQTEAQLQPATRTLLKSSHTKSPTRNVCWRLVFYSSTINKVNLGWPHLSSLMRLSQFLLLLPIVPMDVKHVVKCSVVITKTEYTRVLV